MVSMDITLWVTSIMILAIYSFLYKDNPFFQFAEHIIIGCVAGHTVVLGVKGIIDKGIIPLSNGIFSTIIPIILGMALFLRYVKKYSYVTIYPICILIGLGNGMAMRSIIQAQVVEQLKGILVNIFAGGNAITIFNNLLVIVIVISTISYFIFTKEPKGLLKEIPRLGMYFMMVCFGSVMAGKVLLFAPQVIALYRQILIDWLQLA